jgi:hypothetical protein
VRHSLQLFTRPKYRLPMSRWQPLPDPDSTPPSRERGLKELYTAIRKTVGEEVKIVEHVFPNPGTVVQIFLMRVFAQSVCLACSYIIKLRNQSLTLIPLIDSAILGGTSQSCCCCISSSLSPDTQASPFTNR